eukprot:6482863-Amphidinium_carterae.1
MGDTSSSIEKAEFGATACTLFLAGGERLRARWPVGSASAQELFKALCDARIEVWAEAAPPQGPRLIALSICFMAYIATIFTMMRRLMPGGGDDRTWGDTRQQVIQMSKDGAAGFSDVAGINAAKLEVAEVVQMLQRPGTYSVLGARVPRGVLLVGPPGSGKTLLARACAAEAGVPFLSAVGTEFVEVFVGRGASRVRQLFERARRLAPCMVFIDEVDALQARSSGIGRLGNNQEAESTLNQLLACMDGLVRDTSKPIVVVAATNRPETLDEALLRPGRFDRIVKVELPDAHGRYEILQVHIRLKKVPLASTADAAALKDFAHRCDGLAGAMLEALVNEAAIRAARRQATE